ncbi:hypothetical protein [Flavivirga spongiicola]|uniref:Permease n=1 Tax=Flavivirga spongiicola TaxID=421621 RepID=A0ABU7XPL7_9FLAO|nr:hypothetical protein [Flavivirga sp. MEBiC05379]MDO5977706.1 hypothetical protein [Flavivirga sp. MEBiC05379]
MKKYTPEPFRTILIITIGFLIVHLITKLAWILFVALTIGFLGAISKTLAKKIDYLWIKLTWVLSMIVPNILLTIIFYMLLFPIALLSRFFGNSDPLKLKNNHSSLFIDVNKKFDKSSFKKTW